MEHISKEMHDSSFLNAHFNGTGWCQMANTDTFLHGEDWRRFVKVALSMERYTCHRLFDDFAKETAGTFFPYPHLRDSFTQEQIRVIGEYIHYAINTAVNDDPKLGNDGSDLLVAHIHYNAVQNWGKLSAAYIPTRDLATAEPNAIEAATTALKQLYLELLHQKMEKARINYHPMAS